jgi:hypothetical protein
MRANAETHTLNDLNEEILREVNQAGRRLTGFEGLSGAASPLG